jgi:hypothetical protein
MRAPIAFLLGVLLPPELQKYTVYMGAPVPASPRAGAVADFLKFLTSEKARERLAPAGYSAP